MKEATETQIQRAIMDYLAARKIMAHRLNSGMMRGEYKGKPWAVKLAEAGTADILALPEQVVHFESGPPGDRFTKKLVYTRPIYIEVKTATGQQSPAQKIFQRRVEEMGHRYILARNVDDVERAI